MDQPDVGVLDGHVEGVEEVSVLFPAAPAAMVEAQPAYLSDLNLDQIAATITFGWEEYDLLPFLHHPLHTPTEVAYRHAVFHDLEDHDVAVIVGEFTQGMRAVRDHIVQAKKLRNTYQRQRWFLDAALTYCGAVRRLHDDLATAAINAPALRAVRTYLAGYVASPRFLTLLSHATGVRSALDEVTFCVLVDGPRVTVSAYADQPDYSAEVVSTFGRCADAEPPTYRFRFPQFAEVDPVEARILAMVARLAPEAFTALERFEADHAHFVDPTVARFDREVQFYRAYLHYVGEQRSHQLPFCYPDTTDRSKSIAAVGTFDAALAERLRHDGAPVVGNDFHLSGDERVLVVTGPNQGGKTTLARTFGQLHYLASLGCPVPGSRARLFLFDQMFTHFEQEEQAATQRGKLYDDLVRLRDILAQASADSIIILNEIFTSTTVDDAVLLGTAVMERIIGLDALCVCVTFLDELAALGPSVVSMMSTVDPLDPATRTYKVVRRPPDGLAYAASLAQKHGLAYKILRERVSS